MGGRNSGTSSGVRVDRKHERAEKLFLHYIQRWAKDYLRRRLDWAVDDVYGRGEYSSNTSPRHMRSALCPCQVFIFLKASSSIAVPLLCEYLRTSPRSVVLNHFGKLPFLMYLKT